MSLNKQNFYIKEEPQDYIEGVPELNNILANVNIKLEDDTLQDKPEFINLQSSSINNFTGTVKHDADFVSITSGDTYEAKNVLQTPDETFIDNRVNNSKQEDTNIHLNAQFTSENAMSDNFSSDENDGDFTCKTHVCDFCNSAFKTKARLQSIESPTKMIE
ncbi:hypothetical protein NQ317_007045 [Molorchus minor]|uniref:Uncharacterized protein n=1 Tax=Molorchus minor TaxID=1323400 RepID=A0ABQ9JF68_9CUCU|nr:hypothetical protein NQ317_007045 [Molorchus minor]